MSQIEKDLGRFKRIVRGKIKKNLKKYISRGGMVGKKGKDFISIPITGIDTPRFKFGKEDKKGVGQGSGNVGDPIGGYDEDGEPVGAGNKPGDHLREVELTLDEFAEILGEELALPDIIKKGKGNVLTEHHKYTGISQNGPESLRHNKRTFKETLKRQISTNTYDPKNPKLIPIKRDKRYRSFKTIFVPETNVVVIYIMDVSGSMGEEQKEIVRNCSNWIDIWLRFQYKGLSTRYIIHDAIAREVDRDTFFTTRESGGTVISSAYKECEKMINRSFSPNDWNIYVFQFSDGDNWGEDDNAECMKILERMLPKINLFGYGQVTSPYGSGEFINTITALEDANDNLIISRLDSKEDIYNTIKEFFKKGK